MMPQPYQYLIALNQALTFLSRLCLPGVPTTNTNAQPEAADKNSFETQQQGQAQNQKQAQNQEQARNQEQEQNQTQTAEGFDGFGKHDEHDQHAKHGEGGECERYDRHDRHDGQSNLPNPSPAGQPASQPTGQETSGQTTPQTCLMDMVLYFPLVGMLLAALAALPLCLGLAAAYPALQALIFLALTVWLSRGLHWDGLADLLDACASNASGEKFQAILKDHHLGALGALGLMLALLTTLAALYYLAQHKQWLVLIWSAGAAQLTAFCLAVFAPISPAASLGKIFAGAKLKLYLTLWLPLLLLSGAAFISWQFTLAALAFVGLTAFYLASLAKKHGGYNGDFLGAAIVLGQMAALLAALFFTTT